MPWYFQLSQLVTFISLRYFIIAGIAFVICYILLRKRISPFKIQSRFPKNSDYLREIGFSFITMAIFTAVAFAFVYTPLRGITQWYRDPAKFGYVWYVLAFPVMFIVHDTYFYWTHRLMHHPRVFRIVHLIHHRSSNPSPWTAFSFHPTEALIEAGIFPILLILFPLTGFHFTVFFVVMMVYNVYGHLGWELFPKSFSRNWFGRFINTSVCHNQHHQYFSGNYGLYFIWWDRLMGTVRKDYEEKYEARPS